VFDKLKSMFQAAPEPEFKPLEQKEFNREPSDKSSGQKPGNINGIDKSINIGANPFNRKSDVGSEERIQGKLQLLRELQKELGKYGKT